MATIKYNLRGKTKNPSITLRLSIGRGQVYEKTTGFNISRNDWSFDTALPKQNKAEQKKLAINLKKLESHILSELNKSQAVGETIDSMWLGLKINVFFRRVAPTGESDLVVDAIQNLIDNAHLRPNRNKRGIGRSRIGAYKRLQILFKDFQGKRNYRVKEIDQKTGKAFFKFLYDDCRYDESYCLKVIANLKAVCYEAEMNDIEISPQLKKIESGKPRNQYIIYLSPEELLKIEKVKLDKAYLENARKWILFGCGIGQRGSDLIEITKQNITNHQGIDIIKLKQKKTGKIVEIPILPKTAKIINDGLPHKISLVKLNKYVKEVCELAGIDTPTKGKKTNPKTNRKEVGTYQKYELIASHTFRRSFCSNLYGELPTPVIMQVTGHATEKTFLSYIGKTGMDYKDHWQRFIEKEKSKASKEPKLTIVPNQKIAD